MSRPENVASLPIGEGAAPAHPIPSIPAAECKPAARIEPETSQKYGTLYTTQVPYIQTTTEYEEYDIPEDSVIVETRPIKVPFSETTTKTWEVELPPAGQEVSYGTLALPVEKVVHTSYDYQLPAKQATTEPSPAEITAKKITSIDYDYELPENKAVYTTKVYMIPIEETIVQTKTYSAKLPSDYEAEEKTDVEIAGRKLTTHTYEYKVPSCDTKVYSDLVDVNVKQSVTKSYAYKLPDCEKPVETKFATADGVETITLTKDYLLPCENTTTKLNPTEASVKAAASSAATCNNCGSSPSVNEVRYQYDPAKVTVTKQLEESMQQAEDDAIAGELANMSSDAESMPLAESSDVANVEISEEHCELISELDNIDAELL
uniref:Peptidoglycan-associated protein n=1 Tax=Cyanophora paradoxa TaxID=2762 RepID=A0A0H5AWD6_CYAPA|nr:peptidoglycan-associated protein [Cyanophora paradoxa]|eukprot:tig00001164_g7401.t1